MQLSASLDREAGIVSAKLLRRTARAIPSLKKTWLNRFSRRGEVEVWSNKNGAALDKMAAPCYNKNKNGSAVLAGRLS